MRDIIIVFGDTHMISTVGLCPPEVELDDGGIYRASNGQTFLLECWQNFWNQAKQLKPSATGKRYVIHLGDIIDGNHHGTSQLITTNETIMMDTAVTMLRPVRDWADYMFVVRGTDAHAGEAARWEEAIAKRLDCTPDPLLKTASWQHLVLSIQGRLIDCAHQPLSSTGREWLRGSVAGLVAADARMEYATDGSKPPDLVLRGHNHRISDSGATFEGTRAIVLPSWQLGTGHSNKRHPGKLAHIGGLLISIEDGIMDLRLIPYHSARRAPWQATP